MLSVSFVVLGVVGSKILYVTDSDTGFDGDSSCGGGSSVASNYVLLVFYLLVCSMRAHDGNCSLLNFLPFTYY